MSQQSSTPTIACTDEYFMRIALQEAEKAYAANEVPVGAVIVSQNHVIASAHNQVQKLRDATAHAEMLALKAAFNALGAKYLPACTLYVTLEPCLMCSGASYWAQLARLVFGASDPNRGYRKLGNNALHPKTQVCANVLAAESQKMLQQFFFKPQTLVYSQCIRATFKTKIRNTMASAILQFPYEIPKLPYEWNALEPYIDSRTMEVHHTKHHQTYVDKLNQALAGTDLTKQSLENLLRKVSKHGSAVRNHGGGHYNHSLFWPMLSATAGKKPVSTLAAAINKKFGSLNRFREEFSQAATAHFGSGWAWLCIDKHGNLFVCTTPNQDNPIMDVVDPSCQGTPILGLDVWEHAYYLQYQNRRSAYIEAFWNIVNWEEVNRRFEAAQKKLN